MKIEVGKRYVRRDGSVSPPIEPYGCGVRDPETGFSFYGRSNVFSSGEDALDLIAEFIKTTEGETVATVEAGSDAPRSVLSIKGTYKPLGDRR